jgi:hypothetical protein
MTERRDVVKHKDGWAVTKPGASRASAVERTQQEANKRVAEILHNVGGSRTVAMAASSARTHEAVCLAVSRA